VHHLTAARIGVLITTTTSRNTRPDDRAYIIHAGEVPRMQSQRYRQQSEVRKLYLGEISPLIAEFDPLALILLNLSRG